MITELPISDWFRNHIAPRLLPDFSMEDLQGFNDRDWQELNKQWLMECRSGRNENFIDGGYWGYQLMLNNHTKQERADVMKMTSELYYAGNPIMSDYLYDDYCNEFYKLYGENYDWQR